MILGTSRRWWIFAGILFVLGLILVATSTWDTLGDVAGLALVIIAMVVFAAAPMRYGRDKPTPAPRSGAESAPAVPLSAAIEPPAPRAQIEARDASEV